MKGGKEYIMRKYWYRLVLFVALVVTMGAITGIANAEETTKGFALSPELAKKLGSQPMTLEQIADKLVACERDKTTCKNSSEELNGAFVQLLNECHPGCNPEFYKNNRYCPPVESGTGGGAGSKTDQPTTPRGNALKSGKGVTFVPCLPPAVAKDGVCLCDQDEIADDETGPAPNGDVVTAKTFGSKHGACVPTFEAFKQYVVRTNKTFKWVCRADQYPMTEEELTWFGNHAQWLKDHHIDPNRHLDLSDSRCDTMGMHVVYLLGIAEEAQKDKTLTDPGRAQKISEQPHVQNSMQGTALFVEGLQDHENRIHKLEGQGTFVQLLGTGFYTLRPSDGIQDTVGAMFTANVIYKKNRTDGVLIGFGAGIGKQLQLKEMAAWKFSVEWFHVFNSDKSGPKKLMLAEGEPPSPPRSDPSTLYAMRLGGCAQGAWLLSNVQDEMGGGACGGFQIIPSAVVLDLGIMVGYNRVGRYDPQGERMGYSALKPFVGVSFGAGFNL
jgi:hypothetical protein